MGVGVSRTLRNKINPVLFFESWCPLACKLQGCPEIRCTADPLKKINLPTHSSCKFFPLNDSSTTHMAKKPRSSWKRMIKTGDNVMVGGRPTDIVIPCDSIH